MTLHLYIMVKINTLQLKLVTRLFTKTYESKNLYLNSLKCTNIFTTLVFYKYFHLPLFPCI